MTPIYGPPIWNAREDADASLERTNLQGPVARDKEFWAKLGEEPYAGTFCDVVAPLVHALAAEGPIEVEYDGGSLAVTACEQLMHAFALGHQLGELP